MKVSQEKYSNWMTAVTFAEAGEWDTARTMMPASRRESMISRLQKIFTCVAFAEEGLYEEALRIVEGRQHNNFSSGGFLDAVGLSGVRVTYGVLAIEAC